jgi:arginine/ornithine transport system substrate-binding protein
MPRRAFLRTAVFATLLPLAVGALAQAAPGLPKTLRLAMEGGYPPFSSVAPDGRIVGFDADIAAEICRRLQVSCTQVKMEFDATIPALRAKKVDAIVASMSITPERQKVVAFTDKYYQTPARVVTRADAKFEATPAGLKGRRLGVQRNTIHDRFATATFKEAEIVRYSKQDDVFLDLVSGRIDATLADVVAADQGFLKTPKGQGYAFRGPSYDDPAFFGVGAGIALRQSDTALLAAMNAALAAMRADGTYRKLNDKYFSFDIYGAELKKK